ncbi:hypothetical protein GGI35DRAFT_362165 [Trichoderma velutinum]
MTITQRKLTSASQPGSCVLGRPLTASGLHPDVICYRRRARDGHMTASTGPASRLLQSITISLFQECSYRPSSRASPNPTSHPPRFGLSIAGRQGESVPPIGTALHATHAYATSLSLRSGVELPEDVAARGAREAQH